MKESEKVDKNVNAREIIANVLKELGMNAPSFATATGIAYQRIFDLQRGRTKKFNPGVVNMICQAFPSINKTYLYTGEGSVMSSNKPLDLDNTVYRTHHLAIHYAVTNHHISESKALCLPLSH